MPGNPAFDAVRRNPTAVCRGYLAVPESFRRPSQRVGHASLDEVPTRGHEQMRELRPPRSAADSCPRTARPTVPRAVPASPFVEAAHDGDLDQIQRRIVELLLGGLQLRAQRDSTTMGFWLFSVLSCGDFRIVFTEGQRNRSQEGQPCLHGSSATLGRANANNLGDSVPHVLGKSACGKNPRNQSRHVADNWSFGNSEKSRFDSCRPVPPLYT